MDVLRSFFFCIVPAVAEDERSARWMTCGRDGEHAARDGGRGLGAAPLEQV